MRIGLNVGSGQRPFTSTPEVNWYNVDSQEKWHPDMCCDGANISLTDESVDYFVLSHTAEHFGCNEAVGLLKEAHRVLKPQGSLIITVPDMKELALGWLAGKISTQIYMTCVYGAFMGSEEDRHKWGFDVWSLINFVRSSAPWASVDLYSWRPIPGMDLAKDWWILGVEALK